MTVFRAILLLTLIAPLASCSTTSTPEQIAQRNSERCVARGYKPGTDEFADCVVRVDSERDARMERNRRDLMERPSDPGLPRGY
jgi:hypothetical protein